MATTTSSNNNRTRILMLGAGLSGLALAQALKHHNPPIPFTVFERDDLHTQTQTQQHDPNSDEKPQSTLHSLRSLRSQGYRIRISPPGASSLKRLLPTHLWEAFEATCAAVGQGMTRLDAVTGEPAQLFGGGGGRRPGIGSEGEFEDLVEGRFFNVDRAVVRELLLSGLEVGEGGEVVFGRRAEGYDVVSKSEGGGVEVRFADGSTERGAFLVGADGVRSVIRRQMLPGFKLLDTEVRAVFGKTPLSEDLRSSIPQPICEGIAVCKDGKEKRQFLFCDVMRFDRAAAAANEEKVGVKVPADYVFWTLGFRQDVLDNEEKVRDLLHFSHEQSADLSLELTGSWHDKLRILLQGQDKDASSTLSILTSAPGFEQSWTDKPDDAAGLVAVMGDAAHPMPPVGGVGATTAWQDAHDLFSALVSIDQSSDEAERVAAVQGYETKMLARAVPTVALSAGGGAHLMGMKPVGELKEVEWSR